MRSKNRSSHGVPRLERRSVPRTAPDLARCGRRTGSRPGPPCRRCTGRRRRCRRRSRRVQVRAGLYLVVTSRWRGSSGVATGAPEVDVAEAEHEVLGVEDDVGTTSSTDVEAVDAADELDVPRAPRRVVAHAAPCSARSPRGSAGSSQLTAAGGRCGSAPRGPSIGGQRRPRPRRSSVERAAPRAAGRGRRAPAASGCRGSGRGPRAAGGRALAAAASARAPRMRSARSSTIVAVLDEQVVVAAAAVGDPGRRPGASRSPPSSWRPGRREVAAVAAQRVRARRSVDRARTAPCHRGAAGPSFHRSAAHDRDRADEAAEARAVGAEQDRHVAGEVDGADGVGVVVDVRRVQPGLAAVGPRPVGLRADRAGRRCGRSCSAPATSSRRRSVDVARA